MMTELSDEEKKAIEHLKDIVNDLEEVEEGAIISLQQEEIDSFKKILSLIEKLKKEKEIVVNYKKVITEYMPKDTEFILMCKSDFDRNFGSDYISKDKIKENFAKDIAFKKHLDRRGERIDQYNKGRFYVIEEILELLEE